MNSPIVIASAILGVAIVASAWLLKPPCWTYVHNPQDAGGNIDGNYIDRCTGDFWSSVGTKWVHFSPEIRKITLEMERDEMAKIKNDK